MSNIRTLSALIIILLIFSCKSSHHRTEIIDAMHTYDRLITKMDADSIAFLYASDGELGKVAKGRDSIRKFLLTFKKFQVLLNESKTDSIFMAGDSAVQTGSYRQEVILPSKDTAHLKGLFRTNWIWKKREGWHIKKMETTPI